MKASAIEFRFRFFILAVIYFLGFVAPWNRLAASGYHSHVATHRVVANAQRLAQLQHATIV